MDEENTGDLSLQELQNRFFAEYQTMPTSRFIEDEQKWSQAYGKIFEMSIEDASRYADYVMDRTCSVANDRQFREMIEQCLSWPNILPPNYPIDVSAIAGFALVCLTAKKRGIDDTDLKILYKAIVEKQKNMLL